MLQCVSIVIKPALTAEQYCSLRICSYCYLLLFDWQHDRNKISRLERGSTSLNSY